MNSTLNPPANFPLPSVAPTPYRMPEIIFQTSQIKKILSTLNTNKASGLDNIPAIIVLKKRAPELAPIFTRLFQLSYDKGVFPENWKAARIQPIPKKDQKLVLRITGRSLSF